MDPKNITNSNSFMIELYYQYDRLVKPKALLKRDLSYITGDFVYGKKLNGRRGFFLQTEKKSYVEFENGQRIEYEKTNSDMFFFDIEFINGDVIVLDVLYYNRPMIKEDLYERLSYAKNFVIQQYRPFKDFKECEGEGYIFFNSRIPYSHLDIYKFKYDYTIDVYRYDATTIMFADGRSLTVAPSKNIGSIEEMDKDLTKVIQVRTDKLKPNPAIIWSQVDELATIEEINITKSREGVRVLSFFQSRIVPAAEKWINDNSSLMYDLYEDDEENYDDDPLFNITMMNEDGTFTDEWKEYLETLKEPKFEPSAPEIVIEEVDQLAVDLNMLLEEKIIDPQETLSGIEYPPLHLTPNILKENDTIYLLSHREEIEVQVEKIFDQISVLFGFPLVLCDYHGSRCQVIDASGEPKCVRARLKEYNVSKPSVKKKNFNGQLVNARSEVSTKKKMKGINQIEIGTKSPDVKRVPANRRKKK